jgi:hypothetical protein
MYRMGIFLASGFHWIVLVSYVSMVPGPTCKPTGIWLLDQVSTMGRHRKKGADLGAAEVRW